MDTIWLNSKTKVPSITKTAVIRERLHQLLEEGNSTKLTTVQAPAGYGKTTIISQWINQLNEHTSWLSIGANDNDPIRYGDTFIPVLPFLIGREISPNELSIF